LDSQVYIQADISVLLKKATQAVGLYTDATFETELTSGCFVLCNPAAIVQVFVNIFKNSIEAFQIYGRGKKFIYIKCYQLQEAGNVIVELRELGEGFYPEWQVDMYKNASFSRGVGALAIIQILNDHRAILKVVHPLSNTGGTMIKISFASSIIT
jgi:nitrogen fixation/metabolism regulation signal transduction histidine kinase